jgi:triphosphoribosyl-dephospho-CoA synthase
MLRREKANHISECLELAVLLEVSANKPGNVNFSVGFHGTRVEHFLASAVAARLSFQEAAKRGIAISEKRLDVNKARMGSIMKECVCDICAWQKGGNTLLGTVMLFVPIAVAAGMTRTEKNYVFDFGMLRENLKLAVESTTPEDAVDLYEAIDIAMPGGLGTAPDLDVSNPASKTQILKERVSLYEVFKLAAGYDDICSEWVNNYPITFDLAFPYLMKQLKSREDLNSSIVHTFLKILSKHPDTFIARKAGIEKAREISFDAMSVLDRGGLGTSKGKLAVLEFDKKLREAGNHYNPGTTADITAATLALCVLSGYRP